MATRNLHRKELSSSADARSSQRKAARSEAARKNGDQDDVAYATKFIANGLKLQDELMVNHEAIDAARREYLAEFQRRRQAS